VDDETSLRALHAAMDAGTNFIDTADVYGDGRSERLIARLRRERPRDTVYVATKAGRRLPVQTAEGYSRANLTAWVERSLRNLEVDTLDLLQLHCPPSSVFGTAEVYGILDDLVADGKIRHYGVSVERVDEALDAVRHPGVKTVQIIFNMFRLKPADLFFAEAARRDVGILARVPLASGLLTGKLTASSTFAADDHRQFNRHGESFDKGETFSGVPYDVGLAAVDELREVIASWRAEASSGAKAATMAQFALRWILMFDAVTCAIPGAKTPEQARANAAAADLPEIDATTMAAVRDIYDRRIAPLVAGNW